MTRLIVCYDGTWNNPDQEENGIPSPTNVFKIHNALKDDASQQIYYHPGLGSEPGVIHKVLGGAFGIGIRRHICSGYHWLASNYRAGDEIYLFGFSRGAFTARSLAGLLGLGLIDPRGLKIPEVWERVHRIYDMRSDGQDHQQQTANWTFFNDRKPTPIRFVGVWDTVGALGIPDDLELLNLLDNPDKWRFHDNALGAHVEIARHAMAMDEIRSSFTVTRWNNRRSNPHSDIREVWFAGVHANVGGGYADSTLSDIALHWMMNEAESAGLEFRPNTIPDITDNYKGTLHNSYKGAFAEMRSRPRNLPEVSSKNKSQFHPSVFQRQEASPIEYRAYHSSKVLAVGETHSFDVFADTRWNYSGLYLDKGSYKFSARGQWKDSKDVCDWKGTEDDKLSVGDIVRSTSSVWGSIESMFQKTTGNTSTDFAGTKRVEEFPWFVMTGAICNDGGSKKPVSNDGSPVPHEYVDLSRHARKALKVTRPGYFYCFPNDVWNLYDNNAGSIRLTVKKVS